jgi:hypothetical protein
LNTLRSLMLHFSVNIDTDGKHSPWSFELSQSANKTIFWPVGSLDFQASVIKRMLTSLP